MAQESISHRTVSTPLGSLSYLLSRKSVRHINLRVGEDGSVCVSAPFRVPFRQVDSFVAGHAVWIRDAQLRQHARREAMPLTYAEGEPIVLLGQCRTLHVAYGPQPEVIWQEDLTLRLPSPEDSFARAQLVHTFWNTQCQRVFSAILAQLQPPMAALGVPVPHMTIRDMTSRWGSCSPHRGAITLNRGLLAEPEDCIRYVVLHELCHFVHPDHSPRFYALLAQFMPDYQSKRRRLQSHNPYRLPKLQKENE